MGTTVTASDRLANIPTSMFHVVHVRHKGKYLKKTTRENLISGESDNSYLTNKGTPAHWYKGEGFNSIGLSPRPTGGQGGSVVAEGYRTQAVMTATSVPLMPPQFHQALIDGLIVKLCEEDTDASRNQLAWTRAQANYLRYQQLAERENNSTEGRIKIHPSWNR